MSTSKSLQLWRRLTKLAVLAAALGAVVLGTGGSASAASAASAAPSLTLTAREVGPHQAPGARAGVELIARVAGPLRPTDSRRPASRAGVVIDFSLHLQEFSGAPLLGLGTATTNRSGVAVLAYQPTWSGRQDLQASVGSVPGAAQIRATTSIVATATDPFGGTVEATRPDGMIGRWVVAALLALLVFVWVTLFTLVARVRRGSPRSFSPNGPSR